MASYRIKEMLQSLSGGTDIMRSRSRLVRCAMSVSKNGSKMAHKNYVPYRKGEMYVIKRTRCVNHSPYI